MTIEDTIRGTSLSHYRALVAELGGQPDALLRAAGIRPDDAGDQEVYFEYRRMIDAVESAAAATSTPDFGRRLGARQGIEILGPVGVAARTAATVAEALDIFETYLAAYSPAIAVEVAPMPPEGRSRFEFRILTADASQCPQTIELSLGVAVKVFRFLIDGAWSPLTVHLPHDALTPSADYISYFGCRPRFDDDFSGFTIRPGDLDRPLSSDPVTHQALLDYLASVMSERGSSTSEVVRRLIRELLPTGVVSLRRIALECHLHPKTLQRRLRDEGTTFADEVDRFRQATARRYLRDTDMTMLHLARALGYAEQSVFSRSCRRWFGRNPLALRRALRSEQQAPRPALAPTV